MKAFEYATALSTDSAREFVADNGMYLAGGNDLLGLLKEYLVPAPKILVNVKSLPGLDKIEPDDEAKINHVLSKYDDNKNGVIDGDEVKAIRRDYAANPKGELKSFDTNGDGDLDDNEIASIRHAWKIGALVTVAQLENSAEIKKTFPGLQQAANEVGSQQIRNVATVGGNLAQHSRCWYYRHRDTLCLKKNGDMCYARSGENRYHSLFTGNTCISPVVSNLSIAFAALDAAAIVLRDGKETRMSMTELYQKAWEDPTAHNSLNPGDLILRVEIPTARGSSAFLQTSDKHDFDWALVSCAAAADVSGGKLSQPRVAVGCISPMPHQVAAANDFLDGKMLDDAVASQAADMILKDAQSFEHNAYKVPMAHALIRRTLLKLKG